MSRFKLAFKAALVPAIIGLVASVVGIVLFIIGLAATVPALLWIGIVVAVLGIGILAIAFYRGRNILRAICPECEKFMGDSEEGAEYSFELNQYKENYDKSTHQLKDYTYYYTCSIKCPHCGNVVMFEEHRNAKLAANADAAINEYLKGLLKMNKK